MRIVKLFFVLVIGFTLTCCSCGNTNGDNENGENGGIDSGGESGEESGDGEASAVPNVAGIYTDASTVTASTCPDYEVGLEETDINTVVTQEGSSRSVSMYDSHGNVYSGTISDDGSSLTISSELDNIQYTNQCFAHASVPGNIAISNDTLTQGSTTMAFSNFTGIACPGASSCELTLSHQFTEH